MNNKSPISIFIVEDNPVFALAMKLEIETTFAQRPIKIMSFETGEACMKRFKEEKPQVVILDYNLNSKRPDAADGIKVMDWIKKENSETNVIMLTSEDNIDIAIRSFKHGATDYIVKTETKFKRITNALLNLFKMMKAREEVKQYKNQALGMFVCITAFILGVIAIQIFNPGMLR